MFRRLVNGLYIFALMIMTIGVFCLVSSLNFKKTSEAQSNQKLLSVSQLSDSEIVSPDTLSEKMWSDALVDVSSMSLKTESIKINGGNKTVYQVNNEVDLAYVAYLVNNKMTSSDYIFSLKADIDLSGALWTPIGTSSNPFNGTFIGNGYTIKNANTADIVIDSSSNSVGLFGYVSGTITDVILDGTFYASTTKTHVGSLVGNLSSLGIVINCYDFTTSKSKYNGTSTSSVNSIGNIGGKVYTGDGYIKNNTFTTEKVTDSTKIKGKDSSLTVGYVNIKNDGVFYRAGEKWYEEKFVRFCFNGINVADINNVNAYLYHNEMIKLREDAGNDDVYPLLQGIKYSIPSAEDIVGEEGAENKCYILGAESTKIEVTFDFQYGERVTKVSMQYDQTFKNFLDNNQYLIKRVGYDFEGLYSNSGSKYDVEGNTYNQAYPTAGCTVYPKFIAQGNFSYNVYLAMAEDEKSNNKTSQDMLSSAVSTYPNGLTVNATEQRYRIETPAKQNTSTFTITLKNGFEIDLAKSESSNDIIRNKEKSAGDEYNLFCANEASGIYVKFTNSTGKDPNYNYNNDRNNDSYLPVSISGTKNGNTYTIAVKDIVGKAGEVYIVIKRTELTNDLKPIFVDKDKAIEYEWYIEKNGSYTLLNSESEVKFKLYQTYNLKLVVTGDGAVLDPFKETNFTTGGGANITASPDSNLLIPTLDKDNPYYTGYFYNFTTSNETFSTDGIILKPLIGALKSKVYVKLVNENGETININESNLQYANLGISINDASEKKNYIANASALFPYKTTISSTTADQVYAKNNGYYQAVAVMIGSVTIDGSWENDIFTASSIFVNKIYDGTDNSVINIIVKFQRRSYNLNIKFEISDNDNIVDAHSVLYNFMVNGEKNNPIISIESGYTYKIEINLTQAGKGILYGVNALSSTIVDEDANDSAGYQRSSMKIITEESKVSEGKWVFEVKMGTFNSTATFHFNFKKLTINVNQLYLGNSNGEVNGRLIDLSALQNITGSATFSYDKTNKAVKISGNLGSINIDSQYYLLGWYLKGGTTVTTGNYGNYLTDSSIINDIIQVGTRDVNSKEIIYSNVAAYVVKRTVDVHLNSGDKENGKIYYNGNFVDNTQDKVFATVTYAQTIKLSPIYSNLGYTFAEWLTSWTTEGNGYSANSNFTIQGENWYSLFRGSPTESWNSFAGDEKSKKASITLTATWEIITYTIRIDDYVSMNIEIGQTILMNVTESDKDGKASYTINKITKNGKSILGYVAKKANIYSIGYDGSDDNNPITSFTTGNTNIFKFSVENLDIVKQILTSGYYFTANNNDPIILKTYREAASYRIYINSSTNKYYSVIWNGENNAYGGEENGKVYINVTYNTKPINIQNAVNGKNLIITRDGYNPDYSQWKKTDSSILSVNNPFTSTADINVTPIWVFNKQSTIADLSWTEGVNSVRSFYLFNNHDILNGLMSGVNVGDKTQPSANYILTNGEEILSFGYSVTFNSETKNYNGLTLNISNFSQEGQYKVVFFINIKDTLSSATYTAISTSFVEFTMVKNEIVYFDNDIHSYYNGTQEFVKVEETNNFGSFLFKYDWNGDNLYEGNITEIDKVENAFKDFSIYQVDNDYNVGQNKSLKVYINDSNIVWSGYGQNYKNLFSNVEKDENGYYSFINNDSDSSISVEKAKFTIEFKPGSAYYFDGVTTIVYKNSSNIQFGVGSQTFTYTYNQITLYPNAQPGIYSGKENNIEDSKNFIIEGLSIVGHEQDLYSNFEWNISKLSTFELLNSNNAVKYNYYSKYLLASEGKLIETLAESYEGYMETLTVENVVVNDSSILIENNSQFTYKYQDQVLFTFVNNNSSHLIIYINNDVRKTINNLYFDIKVNISTTRSEKLSLLTWGDNLNASYYDSYLDSAFSADNPLRSNIQSNSSDQNIYAVLTDVVKINLDYNGGTRDGKSTQTIYLGVMNGNYDISNPTHSYSGLSFNNYSSPKTGNIVVSSSEGKNTFTTQKGGQAETLKAAWLFNQVDATQIKNKLTKKASTTGFDLNVDEFADILYPDKTTSKVLTLNHDSLNFTYNSSNNSFFIKNESGMATTDMTGDYKFVVSVTYNDGVYSPQTQVFECTLNLTIQINTIGISTQNSNLIFNNSNQNGNVIVQLWLNGKENGTAILATLPTTDNSNSGKGFFITISSTKSYNVLNKVDTYIISATIDSLLTKVYELESGRENFNVQISQYIINLADYNDKITPSKIFGTEDPNPISATIIIEENLKDEVKLEFTRDTTTQGWQAIGFHILTFYQLTYADDRQNYTVNTDGFESYFEIKVPESKLQVDLKGKLSYTYNGYTLENFEVSYNGSNYTLKGVSGNEDVTVDFDLYYMSGNNTIQIPQDQKDLYATYLTFSSLDVNKFAGIYNLNVALSTSAQGVWSGVEFVNHDNAKIIVNQKMLTITNAVKVFDQTNSFVYNNINNFNNTIELTVEGIITVDTPDEIQISGQIGSALAGEQEFTSFVIDQVGAYSNYALQLAENLKVLVKPSTEDISLSSSVSAVQYGIITNTTDITQLNTIIPLLYNGGQINNSYITAVSYDITDKLYSLGGNYLNVNKSWSFVYNLSSKNYTFGQTIESDLGHVYNTQLTIIVEITPISITISNASGKVITKEYDGNNNVLETFVKQNINANNGYYTSDGILARDIIYVESGTYNDKTIGNNKEITLTLSGANINYTVTQIVKGNITSINLTFHKKLDTENWVNDGIDTFGNDGDLVLTYDGDLVKLINNLLAESSFASRIGYKQKGWTYDNISLSDISFDKDSFLQHAVDAAHLNSSITINAIWDIEKYTVDVIHNDTISISHNDLDLSKQITINYWDSIENISVTTKEGYTFEEIGLENENNVKQLIVNGNTTNTGAFSLINIIGNIKATVISEEITVKIIISYNEPEKFNVDTNSIGWTGGIKERIVSYSELSSTDLPELYVTTPNTYDFDKWQVEGFGNSTGAQGTTTIWERIKEKGFDFIDDDEEKGYTFVAQWKVAELTLTLVSPDNISVSLYKDDVNGQKIVSLNDVYDIYYNDTIYVKLDGQDWYKWSNTIINGSVVSISGDINSSNQATNTTNGNFTLNTIHSSLTITIFTDVINITFETSYDKPLGASINEKSGDISGVYNKNFGKDLLGDLISYYTPQEGTYEQDYWVYSDKQVTAEQNIEQIIISLYGSIPQEDIVIELKAHFEGLIYEITFDKGTPNQDSEGHDVEAVFIGDDTGKDTVTKNWVYGSVIDDIPEVYAAGQSYSWSNGLETYILGSPFITENPSIDLTMTLIADWSSNRYNVQVSYIDENSKIIQVRVDGAEYIENAAIKTLYRTSKSFTFTLETGYEIDVNNTKILTDSSSLENEKAKIAVSGNIVIISNICGDITSQVAIKAKDYTIEIQTSSPETISQTLFNVSFDQEMISFLDSVTFDRSGYKVNTLKYGNQVFATSNNGGVNWTYSEPFVQNNIFKYDGNLVLKAYWISEENYVQAQTTPVYDLIFNGNEQVIANSIITTEKNETVTKGTIFANGDKVIDIYYKINNVRYEIQSDYSLMYRNAITDGEVYVVIELHDTLLDSTNSVTYTIQSLPIKVNIQSSNIIFADTNLETYYSGTGVFYPTDLNNYGTAHYGDLDKTAINELTFYKVVVLDETNQFDVGNNYSVKYYFTATGAFDINNYSGLVQAGSFYTYETSQVTASIKQTPITIQVSGKAFENNEKQQVVDYAISQPDYVKDFIINISLIETNEVIANVYDKTEQFNIQGTVYKDDLIKTNNFVWVITGAYEIISQNDAYKVVVDTKYFDTVNVLDKDDVNIKIVSYIYNNGPTTMISSDRDFFNLIVGDELIFSISSNVTNNPLVQVANGKTVSFTFEVDGNMAVLDWTNNFETNSLLNTLNTLSNEESRQFTNEFSEGSNIYSIFTDYKAILLDWGDKGGNNGYLYIKLGESKEASLGEGWTGFAFDHWQSYDSKVSIEGNLIQVSADAKITAGKITAIWVIVEPTGILNNIVIRNAKADYSALVDDINLVDVLTTGIENKNEDALSYKYQWMKADSVLFDKENGLTVPANTNSNGNDYKLLITVSRTGYTSVSKAFEFTIQIEKLQIDEVVVNQNKFTYENRSFISNLIFTFSGQNLGLNNVNLENMLNKKDIIPYYFTLSGVSTKDIKDAGDYTLNLILDSTIFNSFDYNVTITVAKEKVLITQEDINNENLNSKLFGESEPNFTFEMVMFESTNPEIITINLKRIPGESVGDYLFDSVSSPSDNNFDISLDNQVKFTINISNNTLNIKFNNLISKIYDGYSPTFTTEYDESTGLWNISTSENSSSLILSYTTDSGERILSGELYKLALEQLAFTMPSAIDVNIYSGSDFVVSYGTGANFGSVNINGQVEITKLGIVIANVTKTFDRTNAINASTIISFENKVSGDDVTLTGEFSQIVVGNKISLENLNLSGKDANNYFIANPDFEGSITPLTVNNVSLSLNQNFITYGSLNQSSSIDVLLSLVNGINLTIDGVSDDLDHNYIVPSSWSVEEKYLSSSKNLIYGVDTIKIIFTSPNFAGLNDEGYQVNINVEKLQINLSSVAIVKNYDETPDMPRNLNTNIDSFILSGDIVSINSSDSKYASSDVGIDIKVTLKLTGKDSTNYSVIDNVTGIINEYSITFIVNAKKEDVSLVTEGRFVDDGISPVVVESSFSFKYPATKTPEQIIKDMKLPTRQGYTAVGWKYLKDDVYEEINTSNIIELLKNIANDENNIDSQIEIFTVWEIDYYSINVSGNKLDSFVISADETSGDLIRYYSDAIISVVGERGYKIKAYNVASGKCVSSDLSDIGYNEGDAKIVKIISDITFDVTFEDINITFNIDANIPDYTVQTGTKVSTLDYSYNELSLLDKDNLPNLTVTQGTYLLDGYNYNESVSINDETLQQIIDVLYPNSNLDTDKEITLKAIWRGENYLITFDPNGGSLTGTNPINAVYGSAITEQFPTAHMSGKSCLWLAPDGEYYNDGEIFKSIGTINASGIYEITLTAEWHNNPYDLTLTFNDKLSIRTDEGVSVENGDVFVIVYQETSLTIIIEPDLGYNFIIVNQDSFNGEVVIENNKVKISNLTEDGELILSSDPKENILTITQQYVDKLSINVNGTPYESSDLTQIKVKTESNVEIIMDSVKGYEFSESSVKLVGTGEFTITLSDDKKTITINWINFLDDSTISVQALPSDNIISISDISNIFSVLSLNGKSINVQGDTYSIKTGQKLEIVGKLKYGFENAIISSSPVDYVISQENKWNDTNKVFNFYSSLEGFNENFSLSFTADERTYNFIIQIKEGQEDLGEIISQTNITAKFNESILLQENTLRDEYIFAGWELGGTILSTESNYECDINDSIQNLLESYAHGNEIYIYANYKEKIISMSFKTGNRGEYTFYQNGIEEVRVFGGNTVIREVNLGSDLVINLKPDEGYEFSEILFDSISATEDQFTYNSEDLTITIIIPINSPMSLIEVKFKASEAFITVQAAIQINYETHLGNNEGGSIYLSDAEGNRADESAYLDNNGTLLIGADYKIKSYTDDTIYFVAIPNSGYEVVLNCFSSRVIVSEFNVNGIRVFSVSGVSDGITVQAIFTAKTNTVSIKYVIDNSIEQVLGGKIIVDTSSPKVTAISNSTNDVTAKIVTGTDLIFVANSGISYNLAKNEDGSLKYSIIYPGEDVFEGLINVSQVFDSDIITTGYTNYVNFSVSRINTDATIYIYVQPKTFNLRFYVNENDSVILENALMYGREFSISNLTEEQKNIVFQQREGFTLGGYYTKQLAQGKKYIDKDGKVLDVWLETGYVFNGSIYQKEPNFDTETNTFTIYAAWIYNKSYIYIDFVPTGFSGNLNNIDITDVVVNIDMSSTWFNQENKWYAEVVSGVSLKIRAYEYEGFEFKYWIITPEGQNPVEKPSTFEMTFEQGNYNIQAIYYPKFNITIENVQNGLEIGGTSSLLQNGIVLTGQSFDPTKIVTIEAVAGEGYNFLYWINTQTNEKIYGQYNSSSKKTTYTFDSCITNPLYLKAIFEGKDVNVNLDTSEIEDYHKIANIWVNDINLSDYSSFVAKIGDKITIEVSKSLGYNLNFEGCSFVQSIAENGNTLYTYTLSVEDLISVDESSYKLDIKGVLIRESIRLRFNIVVDDAIDSLEQYKAAKLTFTDANGKTYNVNENNLFVISFGKTVVLNVENLVNYNLSYIYLRKDLTHDITYSYSNGKIVIDEDFMKNYFAYDVQIDLHYQRLVWTDDKYHAQTLQGNGTEDDPYLIHDASEMAFVAYAVNNGIQVGDTNYADCYYKVVSDIDFYGKYWEPIGTEENPFNGIMDLGEYSFTNLFHYRTYSNPNTSYNGLFWHITENAKVIQTNNTLVIVLSVIGSLIFLILLILLIILLIRKKKKKELQEIASA